MYSLSEVFFPISQWIKVPTAASLDTNTNWLKNTRVIIIYLPSLCSIRGLVFKDALSPPPPISAQTCVSFCNLKDWNQKTLKKTLALCKCLLLTRNHTIPYIIPYIISYIFLCLQITNMTEQMLEKKSVPFYCFLILRQERSFFI